MGPACAAIMPGAPAAAIMPGAPDAAIIGACAGAIAIPGGAIPMPGGAIASWEALPNLAWLQIVLIVALFDNSVLAQDPSKAPGDVAGPLWVRYEDTPGFSGKEFKLNAERNNGRAAMMGIIGMMIHEGLTGNPIWPIDYEPGHFPLIPLETVWPGIFSMGNPYPTA